MSDPKTDEFVVPGWLESIRVKVYQLLGPDYPGLQLNDLRFGHGLGDEPDMLDFVQGGNVTFDAEILNTSTLTPDEIAEDFAKCLRS